MDKNKEKGINELTLWNYVAKWIKRQYCAVFRECTHHKSNPIESSQYKWGNNLYLIASHMLTKDYINVIPIK